MDCSTETEDDWQLQSASVRIFGVYISQLEELYAEFKQQFEPEFILLNDPALPHCESHTPAHVTVRK